MDEDPMICRICFRNIEENIPFTPIVNNSVILQNLNLIAFATIRNLQLTEDPLICEGCLTTLKEFAFFKENVITNEFKIQCHQKKDINIFLKSLSPDSERICRLCLKTNPTGPYFTKCWKDNKKMFVKCNIHLNLHILKPSRMCDDCFGMLDKMYKFVCTSIERENEIVLYFSSHQKILEGKDLFVIFSNLEKKLSDKTAKGDELTEPEPVLLDPKDIQIKIKRVGSTYEVEDNNNKAGTSKKETKKASKKRLKAKKKKKKKDSKSPATPPKLTDEANREMSDDNSESAVGRETIDLTEPEANLKNNEELSKQTNSEVTIDLTEKDSEVNLNQDNDVSTAIEIDENNVENQELNGIQEENVVDLTSELLELTPEKPLELTAESSKTSPKRSPAKTVSQITEARTSPNKDNVESLQTKRSARIACRASLLKKPEFDNQNDVTHGTPLVDDTHLAEQSIRTAKIMKCTKITITESENSDQDLAETSLDQEMLQITEYVSKITENGSSQINLNKVSNKAGKNTIGESNEDLIKILTGEDEKTGHEIGIQTDLPYYDNFIETESIETVLAEEKPTIQPEQNSTVEAFDYLPSSEVEALSKIEATVPVSKSPETSLKSKLNNKVESLVSLPKLRESPSTIELRSKNKVEASIGASISPDLKQIGIKTPKTASLKLRKSIAFRKQKNPVVPTSSPPEKKLKTSPKLDDSVFDFTEEDPEDLPPRLSKRTKTETPEDLQKKSTKKSTKEEQKKKDEDIMTLIKKAFEFTEEDEENTQQDVTSQESESSSQQQLKNINLEPKKSPIRAIRRLRNFSKKSVVVPKMKPTVLKGRRTLVKNGKNIKEKVSIENIQNPVKQQIVRAKRFLKNSGANKQALKGGPVVQKTRVVKAKMAIPKRTTKGALIKKPEEIINPGLRKSRVLKAIRPLKKSTVVSTTKKDKTHVKRVALAKRRIGKTKQNPNYDSIENGQPIKEEEHKIVPEDTPALKKTVPVTATRRSKRSIPEKHKPEVQHLKTHQNGLNTDGDIKIHQPNIIEDEEDEDYDEEIILPLSSPSKIVKSAIIKPPGKFLNVSKAVKGKRRSRKALEEAFDRLVEGKSNSEDEEPAEVTVLEEPLEEETPNQSEETPNQNVGSESEIPDPLQELHSLFTSSNKMLECLRCPYKTRSVDMLNQHKLIHTVLDSVQKFKCQLCSFQCKTKEQIDVHKLTHKNRDPTEHFACIYCDFNTRKKASLVNHILRHKDEVSLDEFYCIVLEYAGSSAETMKCFECLQCDVQCDEDTEMKEHIKTHNETPDYDVRMFKCDKCKYQTKEEKLLQRHQQIVHTKPQRYKCRVCRFRSRHDDILKKHEDVHISNGELAPPEMDVEYKCEQCPYITMNKRSLSNHISQKHPRAKTAAAPTIKKEKAVVGQEETGETYRCAECSYTTKRKLNMPRHALVHKTKKNMLFFECAYCVFETKHRRSYTRHMDSMHNVKV